MFVNIVRLIRISLNLLVIAAVAVIFIPADTLAKIPFGPEFKFFIQKMWESALAYLSQAFEFFGNWIDQRVGDLIQGVFDKAQEATQDAASEALDKVRPD